MTPQIPVESLESAAVTLHAPTAEQCAGCGGHEVYALARAVDHEWLAMRLCRGCDRHHALVIAIDAAIEATLSE